MRVKWTFPSLNRLSFFINRKYEEKKTEKKKKIEKREREERRGEKQRRGRRRGGELEESRRSRYIWGDNLICRVLLELDRGYWSAN
ncbi:hypothetical protein Sjap_004496 [Stephania japonica]|uniref:Uncharacterized protein n=1 Tax=Stephania japonica TaxID=461633 RepID=A0AAP0PH25_9MAGN